MLVISSRTLVIHSAALTTSFIIKIPHYNRYFTINFALKQSLDHILLLKSSISVAHQVCHIAQEEWFSEPPTGLP